MCAVEKLACDERHAGNQDANRAHRPADRRGEPAATGAKLDERARRVVALAAAAAAAAAAASEQPDAFEVANERRLLQQVARVALRAAAARAARRRRAALVIVAHALRARGGEEAREARRLELLGRGLRGSRWHICSPAAPL